MQYRGRYSVFNPERIRTYPVSERLNKVKLDDLVVCAEVLEAEYDVGGAEALIAEVAELIKAACHAGKPVIWFTGAHLVKNGLSPLLIDLVNRGVVTLVATNGAGTIHDCELALIGQTSEHVPNALQDGKFGMAREFSYINAAVAEGHSRRWGYGESLGAMMMDSEFRNAVAGRLGIDGAMEFKHPQYSLIAACYKARTPLTVHVGIGTDVTDQHADFDGCAKGACSGLDFLIFASEVEKLSGGGVVLNVGSAVTGPEVLLKAVSMVSNVGNPPAGLVTVNFDLKPYRRQAMADERDMHYYFRDQKSIVTRVPDAFGGKGFYVQGNQLVTVPRLYQEVIRVLEKPR